MQGQFILRHGAAQTMRDGDPPLYLVAQMAGIELHLGAPRTLGVVHRRIDVAHQLRHRGGMVGVDDHAGAGGNENLAVVDAERLGHGGDDGLGKPFHLGGAIDAVEQHVEFVPRQPRYRIIGADAFAQPLARGLQ